MRFLHTADWQIGMKADSVGDAAKRVREERLNAGRRVMDQAQAHEVDFVLVAGDLFEDNAVDRSLVQAVADILSNCGKPVYIIPGNHDPLTPGSVWDHPAWRSSSNLTVLREMEALEMSGYTLYPCPLFEKYSKKNPTGWIQAQRGTSINIGIAHGTVEGIQDEADYPIPRDAADQTGLDYLALGHWHSTTMYPSSEGVTRMAYSGTHEPSKFGERDSGNTLIVEIDGPSLPPKLTQIRTGGLRWESRRSEIRMPGDLERVQQEIQELEHPEAILLDLELSGVLFADEQQTLAHLQDIVDSRFLHAKLDASGLTPSPEDDTWLSSLPPGIIQETAARLRDEASANTQDSYDGQVAALALMELYTLAKELQQ